MSADVPPPSVVPIGPWGMGAGGVSGSGSQVSEISSDLRYGLPTSLGQCIYMSHGLTNELLVT